MYKVLPGLFYMLLQCIFHQFSYSAFQLPMEIHVSFFPSKFQIYMLFYPEKDNCKVIIIFSRENIE